jgi:hypothetical protein
MKLIVLVQVLFMGLVALVRAEVAPEENTHLDFVKTGNIYTFAAHMQDYIIFLTLYRDNLMAIACKSCSLIGDFSFSGGCDEADCVPQLSADANFSMLPVDFTEYWAGVAVDDFTIHIELDISLTPKGPTNEIKIPLLGNSGLTIQLNVRLNEEIYFSS